MLEKIRKARENSTLDRRPGNFAHSLRALHPFLRNTVLIVCRSVLENDIITYLEKVRQSYEVPGQNAISSLPHVIDCIFDVFRWIAKLFGIHRE